MDSPDKKFIGLFARKLNSNHNLVEAGSGDDIPLLIAVPESTFFGLGFDIQDIQDLISRYKFNNVILEDMKFYDLPAGEILSLSTLEFKAHDFYAKLDQTEKEPLYVFKVYLTAFNRIYTQLYNENENRLVEYNSTTGVGSLRGKDFKFKDDQPEYVLFKQLYENYNYPVKRVHILKILKKDDGRMATFFINDLAKKIRKRTGLTTKELVQNNGNITLSI